jgi:hypothetical protein
VKVNRKNTPKMVVRPYRTSEFEKLQRESRRQERFEFTLALMLVWLLAVIIWQVVK